MNGGKEKLVRVQTKDLKVGMFVHDVGRRWIGHPWPRKSKLITSENDIKQLKRYGIREVTVDLNRNRRPWTEAVEEIREDGHETIEELPAVENEPVELFEEPPELIPIEDEIPRAREVYFTALETAREFTIAARAGRQVNVAKVRENIEELIDSAFRNRDAALALLKLKFYDEYIFTHSLNVAVLAIGMGFHMNLTRADILNLGMGAMLHDLGKTGVPLAILNKKGRLTDEEYNTIKGHPLIGARLLEKHQEVPPQTIDLTRHHHERIDGSGYPDGLSGDELNSMLTITSLSDVYDALSSDRIYHKGLLPHEALKTIFALRDKQFNRLWIERFVQCLGIYPAGTLIQLNSGEIGVVSSINRSMLLRPVIRPIFDRFGRRATDKDFLDLQDSKYLDRSIIGVLDPKELKLDLSSYF
ncbi:MAG: HD-GYP domain-containing protein [Candidatus Adiutricales bacterium]